MSRSAGVKPLSVAAFAKSLGLSTERVHELIVVGLPVLPSGRIDRPSALAWIHRSLIPSNEGLLSEANARVAKRIADLAAEVESARVEFEGRKKEYVKLSDVEAALSDALAGYHAKLFSLAGKLAPFVAAETSEKACLDLIKGAMVYALDQFIKERAAQQQQPAAQLNYTGVIH